MKFFFPRILFLATAILFFSSALKLSAQEVKLQFKDDGSFKIAQFTDTHFYIGGENSQDKCSTSKIAIDSNTINIKEIKAEFNNGLLKLSAPKRSPEAEEIHKIDID